MEEAGESLSKSVVIDELLADNATVTILRREATKPPRVWALHTLRMTSVGASQAMPFTSTITNAVPPGQVDTEGSFGPYNTDVPGQTPLMGAFTFSEADLGYFKGIAGTLSAKGTYGGTLEVLETHGETSTPNFSLTSAGHDVPLTTTYQRDRRCHQRRDEARAGRREDSEHLVRGQGRRVRGGGRERA